MVHGTYVWDKICTIGCLAHIQMIIKKVGGGPTFLPVYTGDHELFSDDATFHNRDRAYIKGFQK